MKTTVLITLFATASVLAGCATTPEQQREVGCVGAGVTGALVGGAVGNQFGGGSGQDILTAGGAVAGGLAGSRAAGC